MTLSERIDVIATLKAGKKKDFAEAMGWKPNYLSKLTSGEQGIGLKPIMQLLEKYRDINARWLLFEEGDMILRTKNRKK